jgi:hypothetical protein
MEEVMNVGLLGLLKAADRQGRKEPNLKFKESTTIYSSYRLSDF